MGPASSRDFPLPPFSHLSLSLIHSFRSLVTICLQQSVVDLYASAHHSSDLEYPSPQPLLSDDIEKTATKCGSNGRVDGKSFYGGRPTTTLGLGMPTMERDNLSCWEIIIRRTRSATKTTQLPLPIQSHNLAPFFLFTV